MTCSATFLGALLGEGRHSYHCRECGSRRDVLAWSSLTVLRLPLVMVWRVKPPPESKRKIDTCHLSQLFLPKAHFKNTILFTDGAPAYPAVAEKLNVQHEFVNHSKGQFTKTVCRVQRGSPKVLAHWYNRLLLEGL